MAWTKCRSPRFASRSNLDCKDGTNNNINLWLSKITTPLLDYY